ncbi:sigma-70 family RNA polymerase sigma factor [Jongsikchunia kroppenstedtii]|uniref:sigma-70 family RNA polymerase sigma factor n=1 Tax=Jongsikchunia kroppenstedtii TaxID=1121721 RepID=UPI00037F95D1|nr:sigma-70 family RNA polymerase sigma factor [Jongsikchunia kroppenstedtii]
MSTPTLTDDFEELRPRMLSVGYRLTGSVVDAEDAVQEAWIRLSTNDNRPDNMAAWLTTVVSRLCIDKLRSAASRRESYIGQWLPEPIVQELDAPDDPLTAVVADEGARMAMMVVLDTLPPQQRVSFVLHDAFDVPFAQIAEILDVSVDSARQLASRGRRAVAAAPEPSSADEHNEVLGLVVAAMASGDLESLVPLLHPDVTFTGDSNGTARTAVNVLHGVKNVSGFLLGLSRKYGEDFTTRNRVVYINGRLGLLTYAPDSPVGCRVTAMAVSEGRIIAAYDVANIEKLTTVTFADS